MDVPSWEWLVPIRQRMARARQISEEVRTLEDEHLASSPACIEALGSVDGWTEYIFRVERHPPAKLALRLGEAVHQIRAALDNLVVLLADHAVGRTLDDHETIRHQFPISMTPESFERDVKRGRLKHLPEALVRKIEDVQPYRGYTFAIEEGVSIARHPLARLHAASNLDKHRRIGVVMQAVDHLSISPLGRADLPHERIIEQPPYGEGDVVMRIRASADAMDVRSRLALAYEIPEIRAGSRTYPRQLVPFSSLLPILVDQIEFEVLRHLLGDDYALRAMRENVDSVLS